MFITNTIYLHLLHNGLPALLRSTEKASNGIRASERDVSIAYLMHLIPPLLFQNDVGKGDVFLLEKGGKQIMLRWTDSRDSALLNIVDLLLELRDVVEKKYPVHLDVSENVLAAVNELRRTSAEQRKALSQV
ncbi:MAG TPA: hypothetical protein VMF06_12740 [Candidatus Limnocylindria bacterium]|jgi:hypothetical protein|nr:hypothetical protein [Candidatus Limnocylindria bacterium]